MARGSLLAATRQGVYRVDDKQLRGISEGLSYSLYPSQRDSNRVYVGLVDGLELLQWRDGRWQSAGKFDGIESEVRSMAEDKNGDLWLGTRAAGVLRVTPASEPLQQKGQPQALNIAKFGVEHGLPAGGAYVYHLNNDVGFATSKGLRYFDPETQSFLPDSTLGGHLADSTVHLDRVAPDAQGDVWLLKATAKSSVVGLAKQRRNAPTKYDWVTEPFGRLADWTDQIYQIYPEENHVVWFAAGEALIRYNPAVARDVAGRFNAMVRRVTVGQDSLIFGGHPENSQETPVFAFGKQALRFEFAATSFDDPSANRFQYFLEGFDEDWSSWSAETRKDYTGLPEGNYQFRVRPKNVYERLSSEGLFEFTILAPWYRTWWAYAFYLLCFGLAFYGMRQIEMKRVQDKLERELERVEYGKLKEVDQMKSRFFANISHEFRTPLTLIIGPAEELLSDATENKSRRKLNLIHRNAGRLLQLINQMLDLSKLETGKMRLRTRQGDFMTFLNGLVMSFESWARGKGVELSIEVSAATQPCEGSEPSQGLTETYFDPDKIEKIFTNLLANALKFTPEGGGVQVTVTFIADCRFGSPDSGAGQTYQIRDPKCDVCTKNRDPNNGQGGTPSVNCVEITVRDNGPGIPADRLPHIFDRFYQVDASSTREHEGVGIGLALVKELVQVHNGQHRSGKPGKARHDIHCLSAPGERTFAC